MAARRASTLLRWWIEVAGAAGCGSLPAPAPRFDSAALPWAAVTCDRFCAVSPQRIVQEVCSGLARVVDPSSRHLPNSTLRGLGYRRVRLCELRTPLLKRTSFRYRVHTFRGTKTLDLQSSVARRSLDFTRKPYKAKQYGQAHNSAAMYSGGLESCETRQDRDEAPRRHVRKRSQSGGSC